MRASDGSMAAEVISDVGVRLWACLAPSYLPVGVWDSGEGGDSRYIGSCYYITLSHARFNYETVANSKRCRMPNPPSL